MLTEFRESRGADGSRTALGESRQAFQDAILSSDPAAAQLQAEIIANQIATSTVTSLENQASLKIQFLNILTQAQVDAVLERSGTSGPVSFVGLTGARKRTRSSTLAPIQKVRGDSH